jgi:hypothetical protein
MIGSALSAFLAIIVFAVLPIIYAIYRLRQSPDVKTLDPVEDDQEQETVKQLNETSK